MSEDFDIGEHYRALRETRAESNQARHARALAFLVCSGLQYEAKNGGAHLIVAVGSRAFDYWPGTGKYHERSKRKTEYRDGGIVPFLRACGFNYAQIADIEICANELVHAPEVPIAPSAQPVDATMPPIAYRAHMSRFAVSTYRQAGFTVHGAPE